MDYVVYGVAKSRKQLSDFHFHFARYQYLSSWLICASLSGKASPTLCGSAGKESACNAEDLGLIPGLEKSPGEGKGYPLQYIGLENPMDCIVHGVVKSWTQLSDFYLTSLHQEKQEALALFQQTLSSEIVWTEQWSPKVELWILLAHRFL